jgi:hypothetical protein
MHYWPLALTYLMQYEIFSLCSWWRMRVFTVAEFASHRLAA